MSEMIVLEARFYLSSLVWGMVLAAIYDVFRIFRRIWRHNKFGIAVEDFFFWIFAVILVFRMIYQYNNGIIRFPGMIILFAGMLGYHFLISNPFVNFLNKRIILPIKKMLRGIFGGLKKFGRKVKLAVSKKAKAEE